MTRAPPPGPAFALVLFCLALPCGRHLESGETRECQLGYPLRSGLLFRFSSLQVITTS
jgi:hypothetical protein